MQPNEKKNQKNEPIPRKINHGRTDNDNFIGLIAERESKRLHLTLDDNDVSLSFFLIGLKNSGKLKSI